MKIAPIIRAIDKHNASGSDVQINYRLIHTGQHYDRNMSESFFEQLNIPQPDVNLGAGSGTQAAQTAQIMTGYEGIIHEPRPDVCLVVGDVTSTMACSIVAKKAGVKVAHVEAGIRSGDWTMPEEINRVVTDSITDYFFTTSEQANQNLRNAGHTDESIFFVGNTMIDSLLGHMERLIRPTVFDQGLDDSPYVVLTLHRPSNVDDPQKLKRLLEVIEAHAGNMKILFPVHPRTRKVMESLNQQYDRFIFAEPMPYLEFIYAIKNAKGVITDSGGITEETSVMNVPCITLRNSTERPETITLGTNELVHDIELAGPYIDRMIRGKWKQTQLIPLWDGKTAERIVDILLRIA
jgi:UDP-N-acetylglucosamine 2-epimerase (non-hydrolysing)